MTTSAEGKPTPSRWTLVVPDGGVSSGTRLLLDGQPIPGVADVRLSMAVGDVKRLIVEIVLGDGITVRGPDPTQD